MGNKNGSGLFSFLKRCFVRNTALRSIGFLAITIIVSIVLLFSVLQQQQQQTNNAASTANSKCHWRPEPLQGKCDAVGDTPAGQQYKTAMECEMGCCESESCIAYQYRAKEGCKWGFGDVRLGNEKDGPSAWCEPRAPAKWNGQWIKSKDGDATPVVPGACNDAGWNPNELNGQCFGLGTRRVSVQDNTAQACRDACCADSECRIWQWTIGAGCFYGPNGFNCQESTPSDFEPFVGKRKVQSGRSYTPNAYSGDFADMAGPEKVG